MRRTGRCSIYLFCVFTAFVWLAGKYTDVRWGHMQIWQACISRPCHRVSMCLKAKCRTDMGVQVTVPVGGRVRWLLTGMGTENDMHSPLWHNQVYYNS